MVKQILILLLTVTASVSPEFAESPAPNNTASPTANGLQPTKEMTETITAAQVAMAAAQAPLVGAQILQEGQNIIEMAKAIDAGVPANPQKGTGAIDAKEIQKFLGQENCDRFRAARDILENGSDAGRAAKSSKKK